MARSYDTRVVALTINAPIKWVDNLLSHHDIPGVAGGRQGVSRRIGDTGLLAIELTRVFNAELQVPVARAVALARQILASGSEVARCETASGVALSVRLRDVETRLHRQLVQGLESAAVVRRGRPAGRRR